MKMKHLILLLLLALITMVGCLSPDMKGIDPIVDETTPSGKVERGSAEVVFKNIDDFLLSICSGSDKVAEIERTYIKETLLSFDEELNQGIEKNGVRFISYLHKRMKLFKYKEKENPTIMIINPKPIKTGKNEYGILCESGYFISKNKNRSGENFFNIIIVQGVENNMIVSARNLDIFINDDNVIVTENHNNFENSGIIVRQEVFDDGGDNGGTSNGKDTDGDGCPDEYDWDIDGDGVANECDMDADGDGITNNMDSDDDNDGISDEEDPTPFGPGYDEQAGWVANHPGWEDDNPWWDDLSCDPFDMGFD